MSTKEVLSQLRHHYREHLSWCKKLTDEIAAYMANNGYGCTVFVNDNLQIEIIYNIPRGGPEPVPTLRMGFDEVLGAYCKENGLVYVLEESIVKKDFCLPREYMKFYTERIILDIE